MSAYDEIVPRPKPGTPEFENFLREVENNLEDLRRWVYDVRHGRADYDDHERADDRARALCESTRIMREW